MGGNAMEAMTTREIIGCILGGIGLLFAIMSYLIRRQHLRNFYNYHDNPSELDISSLDFHLMRGNPIFRLLVF